MAAQPGMYYAAVMPVDVTPPIGTYLDGYGARKDPSNDIHDPLFATMLMFKAGDNGVAVVTMDLVGITLSFTEKLKAALSPVLGIPEDAILVSAIHTHAGPVGFMGRVPLLGNVDDPVLQEIYLRKLKGAAVWVKDHLQPVHLGIGRGEIHDIGRNRNDPETGLMDAELGVLRVDDVNGQPLAVLMNYGCHPTVLGPENLAISADYPGAARTALKRIYPGSAFLFTNGASGDVSTRFTRRGQGFAEVERMGNILAGEVLKVMQVVTPVEEVVLSSRVTPVQLTLRHFPPVDVAQKQIETLEAELEQKRAAGLPPGEIRKAVTKLEGAHGQLDMAQSYGDTKTVNTLVQMLRIGPMALVTMPGEPFTHIVLEIKKHSPIHPTFVVSYGNDYRGYFPDAVSVTAGTYEALTSPYDETAGDKLVQTALTLLAER
jgi:neutral ceramidase